MHQISSVLRSFRGFLIDLKVDCKLTRFGLLKLWNLCQIDDPEEIVGDGIMCEREEDPDDGQKHFFLQNL